MSDRLPPIRSLNRFFVYALLLEMAMLIPLESLYLWTSIHQTTKEVVEPSLIAVQAPSQLAVELLNKDLAKQVAQGLISTGYFRKAALVDDFGETLASVSTSKEPPKYLAAVSSFLGPALIFETRRLVPARTGRNGVIIAEAYLVDQFAAELKKSISRTLILLVGTSLLLLVFARSIVNWIDGGVHELISWTDKASRDENAVMPPVQRFRFREMSVLANRMEAAFTSQRKSLTEVLAMHKERADTMSAVAQSFQQIDIYSSLFDPQRQILFSNAAESQSLVIRNILIRFPNDEDAIAGLIIAAGSHTVSMNVGANKNFERTLFRLQILDGKECWVLQASRLDDGYVLFSASKITDIRDNERKSMHREKLESLGRLLGGVAHEFNNVLGIISGNVDEALELVPLHNDQLAQNLLTVKRAGERAKITISQLAQLSQSRIDPTMILVLDEWESSAEVFFRAIIGPGVSLEMAVEPGLKVVTDPSLFDAAILNICKNAADAMNKSGGITIEIGRALPADLLDFDGLNLTNSFVSIVIRDTGPGIPPEHVHELFDPFFTTKPVGEGTGLGLSTVDAYVKNSGGGIRLDTEVDAGACFRLVLPGLESSDVEQEPVTTNRLSKVSLVGLSILVVDDERALNEVVCRGLENAGAEAIAAMSLKEARQKLAAMPKLDLALLDNALKDGTGPTLIKDIHARFPATPCICLSGNPSEISRSVSTIRRFVAKPVSLKELVQIVAEEAATPRRST